MNFTLKNDIFNKKPPKPISKESEKALNRLVEILTREDINEYIKKSGDDNTMSIKFMLASRASVWKDILLEVIRNERI